MPVSVSVFSAKTLAAQGIETTADLQRLVPGVILNSAGSTSNTTYTIRGQGKAVSGPGLPSVITYFNEVPLPGIGSFTPTFDVSNVQILKGPQGTLFGRNTTGGAVLVYSVQPDFRYGGYLQADLGSYDKHYFQGAVNLPIVPDKLAVRISGDLERRDGYTKNLATGDAQDDVDSNALRVSVLLKPTEWLRNLFVYDYQENNENGAGFLPIQVLNPQLAGVVAAQNALGDRTLTTPVRPFDNEVFSGLSNTTTAEFDDVTVKNIFGYRYSKVDDEENDSGLPTSPLPNLGPALGALGYVPGQPGTLITTNNLSISQQYTDELQFSGHALDDKLSWLVGAFYLSAGPAGKDDLVLDLFRPTPPTATTAYIVKNFLGGVWPVGALDDTLYTDSSKALFGNVSYQLDKLLPFAPGFKINAGFRYTWDREGSCSNGRASIALATGRSLIPAYDSIQQCAADTGSAYGPAAFKSSAPFEAPTYTIGLDYAVKKDLFLYFTTRRGYRAGGLNTPALAPILSPFQTFQPQTVTDYEIGAHDNWRLGTWSGRVNIAAFTGTFSQLQLPAAGITAAAGIPGVTAQNVPSDSSLEINAGTATAQGVELDGLVSPFPGFNVTYGASYLDEHYDNLTAPAILKPFFSAANFSGAPKWSFQASAQYLLPLNPEIGDVTLHGDIYYLTKEYQVDALLPAYSLTNLHVQWSNIYRKPVDLTVYVDNLFDRKYVEDVILSIPSFGIYSGNYAPPRMFGARLKYSF